MRLIAIENEAATRCTTTQPPIIEVSDNLDLAEIKREYKNWYHNEYEPAYRKWRESSPQMDSLTGLITPPPPAHFTFKEWLIGFYDATERTIGEGEIVTVEVLFV